MYFARNLHKICDNIHPNTHLNHFETNCDQYFSYMRRN